jgi:LPXTG-motif cell wall-anchored protein
MKLRQATSGAALTLGAVLLSFSLPQLAFAADGDAAAEAAAADVAALDEPCIPILDPDCELLPDPDPEPTDPEPTIPEPTLPTPDPEPTDPEPTIPTPDPEPTNPQPSTPTPTIPNPGNGGGNGGGGGQVGDGGAVAPGAGNSTPQGPISFDPALGGLVAAGSGAVDDAAAGAEDDGDDLPATGAEGGLNLLAGLGAAFLLIGVVLLRRPYAARHRLA